MSLSVFTNSGIISLTDENQDAFMSRVLTPDTNNKIQGVQTFVPEMLSKAMALPLTNGIDEATKKMILAAFADLKAGDRFLCNPAVITDIESAEAKYYLRLVSLMNDGTNKTPNEAQELARNVESDFDVVTMPGTSQG